MKISGQIDTSYTGTVRFSSSDPNATLPAKSQVRRVLLLQKELEADDNEMTRTRKVRRSFVMEKYAPVIEAFYNGGKQVQVTMEITFEDGRKSELKTDLTIEEVPADGKGSHAGRASQPKAA